MAAIVARALAAWAYVEAELSQAFVELLGANAGPGLAMYSALQSSQAQNAALTAAARASLDKRFTDGFDATMNVIAVARRRRNEFAHYLWAFEPGLDNTLILIEPAALVSYHEKRVAFDLEWKSRYPERAPVEEYPEIDLKRCWVYGHKELYEVAFQIERAWSYASDLRELVTSQEMRASVVYNHLCSLPDIRAILDRKRQSRANEDLIRLQWPRSNDVY